MTDHNPRGTPLPLTVLYVDGDQEPRDRIHNHDAWTDVTVETVGNTTSALTELDEEQYDVLVFEPTSLSTDVDAFVTAIKETDSDMPVVLYTRLDSSEVGDSVLSRATTLVEKGSVTESLEFLRDKVAAVSTQTPRDGPGVLDSYEMLVEAARDGIYVLGGDGRFLYANQSMADLVGYDQGKLLGMHASRVMAEGELERGQALIQDMVADGESESDVFNMTFKRKDGEEFVVGLNFSIIYDEGTYAGIVGVARDVTDQIERESELVRQNERLEEFARIVSHDLRNPINVAQMRVDLARDECGSEHLEGAAGAIERSLALIEDMLTLAEAGEQTSDMEPVDVSTLAATCWKHVETGDATILTDLDLTVRADKSRFRQLLENLFRNAIDHGGDTVTITVGALPDGIYVEDDGPGIPEPQRDEVFEPGFSTSEAGTGFGLSIVKQIVEAHGWEIRVTEGSESGARFQITGIEFTAE